MQTSLFTSSIKSFLVGLFTTLGVGVGILGVIVMLASLSSISEDKIESETYFEPTVVSNTERSRKEFSKDSPIILKVNISGVIGTEFLSMDTVRQLLVESREGVLKDSAVKAILVYINTPGGTATDSDGIYRALKDYKAQYNVPIFAYVDGACLSGGMYIASACDQVFASTVSIIGSVGTVSGPFFNVTQTMDKLGIEAKTLTQGEGKDPLNPFRPWKPDEAKEIELIMQALYDHFVEVVAQGRPKVGIEKLKSEIGAHFFPAKEALEIGLIDGQGQELEEVIKLLATKANIDPKEVQVIEMQKKLILSNLFRTQTNLLQGKIQHTLKINPQMDSNFLQQLLFIKQ
jgi:protease-4